MKTESITNVIDKFVSIFDISNEDYNTLVNYIEEKLRYYRYGHSIKGNDVANEVLLYIKTKKKQYDISYNPSQKRRYLNYIIFKCIQKIIKVVDRIVDAGINNIFPLDETINKSNELKSLSYTLHEDEAIYIDNTSENVVIVNNIMNRLGELTDMEYDVFIDIFMMHLTQEQCAANKKLTQQRISQIIESIKSKLKKDME